jgi:hypothetical protein
LKAQLLTNDEQQVVLELDDIPDFPDNPQIIVWQHRGFVFGFQYGGGPLRYQEQKTLDVGGRQ